MRREAITGKNVQKKKKEISIKKCFVFVCKLKGISVDSVPLFHLEAEFIQVKCDI